MSSTAFGDAAQYIDRALMEAKILVGSASRPVQVGPELRNLQSQKLKERREVHYKRMRLSMTGALDILRGLDGEVARESRVVLDWMLGSLPPYDELRGERNETHTGPDPRRDPRLGERGTEVERANWLLLQWDRLSMTSAALRDIGQPKDTATIGKSDLVSQVVALRGCARNAAGNLVSRAAQKGDLIELDAGVYSAESASRYLENLPPRRNRRGYDPLDVE